MTARRCPRFFEAEAIRDGRLGGAEKASFERHLRVCASCAGEVRALDALAYALRAAHARPADELRVRRARTELLAAFDRELFAPRRPLVRRSLVFATVLIVAAALSVWQIRRGGDARLADVSGALIRASDGAAWSQRTDGDREIVVLERGGLWIHVDHARVARRLLVILPDGELEDRGTTFAVNVEDGRTTRVAVEEGSVALRLRDHDAVELHRGGVWSRSAPRSPVPARALPTAPAAAPSSEPVTGRARPASIHVPRDRGVASSAILPVAEASAEFQQAVSALRRGDDRVAARGFSTFLSEHPRDARAEDAAYLRVVALQRCGDGRDMKSAAAEYLRLYPAGFRREEVESLSR